MRDAEQFTREGYFIDRGALSGEDLARLEPCALAVKEKVQATLPEGTRFWPYRKKLTAEQEALGTWGINEITRPSLFDLELVNVWALPRVMEAVNLLLEEPRAWGVKMLWTPKVEGYDLGWHRDQMPEELYDYAHTKPAKQDHIQFNAALHADDCFLVVPGSHRRPLTEEEWDALENDKTRELPGQVVAALEPGDILYMDAHALHRGRSPVEGDRLTLHYSAQAQWVPLHPWCDAEEFERLRSGEFIANLAPGARPLYERLRTAERTKHPMSFLHDAARRAGWEPSAKMAEKMAVN